jgi:hypothetical protein
MTELGRLPACELEDERSSVLLAFGKDDDDGPMDAPLVPVSAAVAFL